MTNDRFALISRTRVPLRVAEAAATLPELYTLTVGPGARLVTVAVGTADSRPLESTGVLLLRPSLSATEETTQDVPLILADRWSGAEVVHDFLHEWGDAVSSAGFIHVRINVPPGEIEQMEDELLGAVLLLDRLGISNLGPVSSSILNQHGAFISSRLTAAQGVRVLRLSIATTDADFPSARVDFHGDGIIHTLVVFDRGAGAASGSASRVDKSGERLLPALYADPIRSSLLRLRDVMQGDAISEDHARLGRSRRETVRILADSYSA